MSLIYALRSFVSHVRADMCVCERKSLVCVCLGKLKQRNPSRCGYGVVVLEKCCVFIRKKEYVQYL